MPRLDPAKRGNAFVVQKHWARNLHYDFRLQVADKLASWAVPKGPSLDPSVKRLAVRVEDHPLDYLLFEGVLPEGMYGAGRVIVWDYGTYELLGPGSPDIRAELDGGEIAFALHGRKLGGGWTMIRTKTPMEGRESWLWIKKRDSYAVPGYDPESEPASAITGVVPDRSASRGEPSRSEPKSRRRA